MYARKYYLLYIEEIFYLNIQEPVSNNIQEPVSNPYSRASQQPIVFLCKVTFDLLAFLPFAAYIIFIKFTSFTIHLVHFFSLYYFSVFLKKKNGNMIDCQLLLVLFAIELTI